MRRIVIRISTVGGLMLALAGCISATPAAAPTAVPPTAVPTSAPQVATATSTTAPTAVDMATTAPAASGGAATDLASLMSALQSAGATVVDAGPMQDPLLPGSAHSITVNGAKVEVLKYADPAALRQGVHGLLPLHPALAAAPHRPNAPLAVI